MSVREVRSGGKNDLLLQGFREARGNGLTSVLGEEGFTSSL